MDLWIITFATAHGGTTIAHVATALLSLHTGNMRKYSMCAHDHYKKPPNMFSLRASPILSSFALQLCATLPPLG